MLKIKLAWLGQCKSRSDVPLAAQSSFPSKGDNHSELSAEEPGIRLQMLQSCSDGSTCMASGVSTFSCLSLIVPYQWICY
ncbi:hypothetical protein CRG98_032528 [Punica granatum]|uniref:Uncharacterized protein n=1 Tax=Punica granatum TaxID=22663 RepID=A0A2I0ISX6_PUNGR|nr:hypothetical protein CRG98_032528 [Punica granatum]